MAVRMYMHMARVHRFHAKLSGNIHGLGNYEQMDVPPRRNKNSHELLRAMLTAMEVVVCQASHHEFHVLCRKR